MDSPAPATPPAPSDNPWPLFPDQSIREHPLPPVGAETAPIEGSHPAGFWRRVSAFWIDLFLVEIITLFFLWLALAAENLALAQDTMEGFLSYYLEMGTLHNRISTFLFLTYFSFFTFYGGQTPGKMVWRLRVVTTDGLPLSWLRAVGRTFAYYLSFFTLGLGFLLAAFPPAKRALHDYVAGTRVVEVNVK